MTESRHLALARRLAYWGAFGFLATSLLVALGLFDAPDLAIDRVAYQIFGDDRRSLWNLFSLPGATEMSIAAVAIAALLAWRAGSPRRAAILVVVALAGGVLVDGLKDAFERPYPDHDRRTLLLAGNETVVDSFRGVRVIPANATDPDDREAWLEPNWTVRPANLDKFPERPANAYPSGHTIGAAVSWGLAILMGTMAIQRTWRLDRAAVAAALLVAGVVGVNRVMVRSHWASDVLGAWFLGAALVGLAFALDLALKERWPDAAPR